MYFDNDNLFNSMSDAAQIAAKSLNNLDNTKIQEFSKCIQDVAIAALSTVDAPCENLKTDIVLLKYSNEIITNLRSSTSMNILRLNQHIQNICDDMPDDIEINFTENELNTIENISSSIETYNEKLDTNSKIKIPLNKRKICIVFLLIIIRVISGYLDCDEINTHLSAITDGFLASIVFSYFDKPKE